MKMNLALSRYSMEKRKFYKTKVQMFFEDPEDTNSWGPYGNPGELVPAGTAIELLSIREDNDSHLEIFTQYVFKALHKDLYLLLIFKDIDAKLEEISEHDVKVLLLLYGDRNGKRKE